MAFLLNQLLSLYIPRVFSNIDDARVKAIFKSLDIGDVSHVDFVQKNNKNGKTYNSIYIHFSSWYDNKSAANFQENVLNPNKKAKLVYDDPWFWIVLENKSIKKEESQTDINVDVAKFEDNIQQSKIERDFVNARLKNMAHLLKENEALKKDMEKINEYLNKLREDNLKLEHLLETESIENIYLHRENTRLIIENENLLDELRYNFKL